MRTTIRMNSELARRAKAYAAKHETTFTDVVEEAVAKLLSEGTPRKQRKKIVLPVVGDPKNRITQEQLRQSIEQMYDNEAEQIMRGYR